MPFFIGETSLRKHPYQIPSSLLQIHHLQIHHFQIHHFTTPPLPPPTNPPPPNSPLIPLIFQQLREKIFYSIDPLEFTPEELVGLEQLKALDDKNPILQNNRYFRIIRELYDDLVLASKAYEENKSDFDVASFTQEQTKVFENLFRWPVACFKYVRDSFEKTQRQKLWETLNNLASPELYIIVNRPELFTSSKPNETTSSLQESLDVYTVSIAGIDRILPKMDFTLDPKYVFLYSEMTNKANGVYKEVGMDYQNLLTSYNLRELYDSYSNAYRAYYHNIGPDQ